MAASAMTRVMSCTPRVWRVVQVDLADCVAPNGELGEAARLRAFESLVDLPDAADVELLLGDGKWLAEALQQELGDLLRRAGRVTIKGAYLPALNAAAAAITGEAVSAVAS